MAGFVAENIYGTCTCYSLVDVCRLERDVACTSETLLLLAYAVASLRPKSHACPETGFSGAQTGYIGHKMPGMVHNFNLSVEYRQEMN